MSQITRIEYCVFLIWSDSIDYTEHIDTKKASEIISCECEDRENDIVVGYDLAKDLYYMTPESFMKQWNWLVENKPESYEEIPIQNIFSRS